MVPHRLAPEPGLFRRGALQAVALGVLPGIGVLAGPALPAFADYDLSTAKMTVTASGLKYTDVKIGEGDAPRDGMTVTIDYSMATTGGRYGITSLDKTKDHDGPYSFVLGDPKVIAGLQEGVSTMRPGGIRRLIIPNALGYTDNEKVPIPPSFDGLQRFRIIYWNENRKAKPDLIFDVKLFSSKSG